MDAKPDLSGLDHDPADEAQPASVPRLSTGKKLIFALVMFVALVGIAEIVCRILKLGRYEPVAHYISDWHDTPEGRTFWVVRGPGYNADGMRDREHAVEKPPAVHRIVCLGDSVTVGRGVQRMQSYPYLFEAFLTQIGQHVGFSVEVLNVAASGWSTRQQVAAYQTIARRYQPDEVFLGFCLNDVAEMYNNLSSPPPAAVLVLVRNSALIRWLINAEGRQITSVQDLFDNPDSPAVQVGWQLVLAELEALQHETQKDSCKLSVVIFPFRFQLDVGAPVPIAQQRLVDFCRSRGIPCLDLLPALGKIGPSAFIDESHLSPTGAQAVAEELIRWGTERSE